VGTDQDQLSNFSASLRALPHRKLMGPAMLVTLGVLFLIGVSRGFGRTWPAILLVIGVVKLVQSNASSNGHVGTAAAGFLRRLSTCDSAAGSECAADYNRIWGQIMDRLPVR
jgi:hypothetical protein